jgi:electron transport complex protein RnfG
VKLSTSRFYPIILLTIVVFLSVVLIIATNTITQGRIQDQQAQQIQGMLKKMFPDMDKYTLQNEIYTLYATDQARIGYAFLATGKGYGGDISILIGLENETTVKAISIISQSETPGLGDRITGSSFLNQFDGVSIDSVKLKRNGGQIDAITGSTISSSAVVNAVRITALEKVQALSATSK